MSDCVVALCKVSKNEIAVDEVPTRAFMWRKGRENKDGEFVDPRAKQMSDYLVSLNMRVSIS
jgi:protein-tyrosine-phosphatase